MGFSSTWDSRQERRRIRWPGLYTSSALSYQNGGQEEALAEFLRELHAVWRGRRRVQDRRRPHRASQAPRAEPGRDAEAGHPGQALQRRAGLHQEDHGQRGPLLVLARQPGQRSQVLPHAGPQLRLQGHHQGGLQHPEERQLRREVREEHPQRRLRRLHVAHLRLLPRLRPYSPRQRRQVEQKGRRAPVQRPYRRLQEDPQVRRHPGTVQGLHHLVRRHLHLPRDVLRPLRLAEAHLLGENASVFLSFFLGWGVTVTAGLMSYPIDTIRRRMMMTSGAAVKYKNSLDCGAQILKNEGFMSMMKGAGANVLRGVAGAGVLAGFDAFKGVYIAWRVGS